MQLLPVAIPSCLSIFEAPTSRFLATTRIQTIDLLPCRRSLLESYSSRKAVRQGSSPPYQGRAKIAKFVRSLACINFEKSGFSTNSVMVRHENVQNAVVGSMNLTHSSRYGTEIDIIN